MENYVNTFIYSFCHAFTYLTGKELISIEFPKESTIT